MAAAAVTLVVAAVLEQQNIGSCFYQPGDRGLFSLETKGCSLDTLGCSLGMHRVVAWRHRLAAWRCRKT